MLTYVFFCSVSSLTVQIFQPCESLPLKGAAVNGTISTKLASLLPYKMVSYCWNSECPNQDVLWGKYLGSFHKPESHQTSRNNIPQSDNPDPKINVWEKLELYVKASWRKWASRDHQKYIMVHSLKIENVIYDISCHLECWQWLVFIESKVYREF